MKKTALLPTLIALVLGAAGVFLLLFAWHLPPFAPETPRTENAYLRGEVTQIAPQAAGYVTAVEVTDFQTVAQGDIIARIDDRIPRQRLAQAEAQLAATRAALKVAEQEVHSAEAAARASAAALAAAGSALETTRSQAERVGQLLNRGVSSQSATDQALNALQQAEAAQIQASTRLEVQNETVQSARVALDARAADISAAKAAVELAKIELTNTVVRAPADGTLGQLGVHLGQYVTPGTALVSHVGTRLWVVANFRETNIKGLAPGAAIAFSVDALGGRRFAGHVEALSPATASEFGLMSATASSGNFTKIAQRLPVRIAIAPEQAGAEALRAGMSVVVDAQ
ncbi:HlyD family secretion protein [Pseudorhodobacter sp. MZDSW-24AT]|uniref:HlyD family secretion protein n=1 Tax=Pseudorhodobacter sp. MZDSW-24AT TaxID=2052957 RepID=UPI000C1EB410|nr:HlyD family secretion protein [Pseudorhodobacter sp. MZDSW-24AT]PJF09343.1 hemolysin secretion protein D [Pseudorhodobacter sp. MZDSW-24AT]